MVPSGLSFHIPFIDRWVTDRRTCGRTRGMDREGNFRVDNNSSVYFDVKYLHECYSSCLLDEDDIYLESYLNAYKELCKFCRLMGSFFSFIETEINSKSAILTDLIGNDENGNFSTVKSMMRHEMDSGLLKKSGYVSGCRTLLRLHRGLDFIRQFLKHVYELRSDEGTSSVCMKVYSKTLGNFHPWLIRQGAYLAMYTLPSRAALLNRVCGDSVEISLAILPEMLEIADEVYSRTEVCFRTNNLSNLP